MNNITCERYYKLLHMLPMTEDMIEDERGECAENKTSLPSKLCELYKRLAETNPEIERLCKFWTYALNALPIKDTYNKAEIDYLERCIEGMLAFVQVDGICLEQLGTIYTTNDGDVDIYATLEIGISVHEPSTEE